MAAVVDPLATLRQALSLAADSPAQASVLASLREYLETVSPSVTILILKNLVPNVQHQTDSLFKQWVFELVWYIVSRLPVNPHDPDRIRFILDVVDPLRELLADQNPFYMKLAIQTLGSVYPQVFRLCCSDPSLHPHWLKMVDVRTRVLDYNTHPTTPLGVRLAVVKFIQRVILVHSKGPSDPRLHNPNDPHLLFVPANHPFFNVAAMDKERISLTEQLLVTFWNGRNPDVSTAVVQAFGSMAKSRPDLIPFVFGAFLGWDPSKLASESVVSVRSIFKAMRIALLHFNRAYPQGRQKGEVEDAIRKLDAKLHDTLAHVEEARRKRTTPTVIAEPAPIVDDSVATRLFQAVNPNILADFDFSTVPSHILAQIVTESLRLIDADLFEASIEKWQESRPIPQTEPAWEEEMEEDVVVKEEPIDPLIMDLEEEDAQVNVVDDMDSDTLVRQYSSRAMKQSSDNSIFRCRSLVNVGSVHSDFQGQDGCLKNNEASLSILVYSVYNLVGKHTLYLTNPEQVTYFRNEGNRPLTCGHC
ncbi:hypothetical protein FS842_007229 [Serendipita sp. 407]|nr:hypothetical protein FS842_007229 [Serendipita sp. 407]